MKSLPEEVRDKKIDRVIIEPYIRIRNSGPFTQYFITYFYKVKESTNIVGRGYVLKENIWAVKNFLEKKGIEVKLCSLKSK